MDEEKLSTIDIECDIHVASSLLNGFRAERQPELSRQQGNLNYNLSLYCHLAQLLNVGEQSDIVTTGSVTFDPASGNVQAETIVVAANSDKFENTTRKDTKVEWEFKDLGANESLDATEVKNIGNYPSKPVKLETHIQDLLAVYKLAKSGQINIDDVNEWIVGRCWSSIYKQINKLAHWGGEEPDLVERLRKWRPAKGELQLTVEFEPHWPSSVATFFGQHDLNPTASGKYTIDASTAPKWIGAIANLLDDLRQTFKDELKDGKPDFLTQHSVYAVSTYTFTLYVIFCNRELQDLFGLNSLKEITPDYLAATHIFPSARHEKSSPDGNCSNRDQSAEADHGLEGRNEDSVGIYEYLDDLPIFSGSYIPVGLRESRIGDFLFRYLRTLVAWQQAVHLFFAIGGRLDILSSLRVCCITLTTHNKLDEKSSLLDSTKRVFGNKKVDAGECQAAQSWIEEQLKRDLVPAHVHPEAGLLALIFDAYQGRVDADSSKGYVGALKPLGTLANYLPIGGTKKCCALCYRLAELIQKEMPYTKLELPATHGIIYPWVSPPHIPRKILVELREELINEVVIHAVDQGRILSQAPEFLETELPKEEDAVAEIRELIHNQRKR